MSTDKLEPAAPSAEFNDDGSFYRQHFGLTAREHAAIALRVPDSGNDWLDAMIRTAQRNDLEKTAMLGLLSQSCGTAITSEPAVAADYASKMADAMLSASAAHSAEGE